MKTIVVIVKDESGVSEFRMEVEPSNEFNALEAGSYGEEQVLAELRKDRP